MAYYLAARCAVDIFVGAVEPAQRQDLLLAPAACRRAEENGIASLELLAKLYLCALCIYPRDFLKKGRTERTCLVHVRVYLV